LNKVVEVPLTGVAAPAEVGAASIPAVNPARTAIPAP
jgi:hypothetical protein